MLTALASIKHFYSLRYPAELSPTDLKAVARVVRGLERATRKPPVKKEGVSGELFLKIVNFLLPDGFENCSISALRNCCMILCIFLCFGWVW